MQIKCILRSVTLCRSRLKPGVATAFRSRYINCRTTLTQLMKARYTCRIYPNCLQQNKLAQVFGCVRVVYNDALARVKATPKGEKWPSNAELQKRVITQAKQTESREWLLAVSVVPLQQSVQDLGIAFKNWFAALKGQGQARFPRFKKRANA